MAIAHCVGRDLKMGTGIAKTIKSRYAINTEELTVLNVGIGKAIFQHVEEQKYIYHLVTKEESAKPTATLDALRAAVKDMLKDAKDRGFKEILMPRLGCGLDRLQWAEVQKIISEEFQKKDISPIVFSLPQNKNRNPPKIFIVGDSHTKKLARAMDNISSMKIETFGVSRPGALFEQAITNVECLANELTPQDTLVIMAGTNDFSKNNNIKELDPESIKRIVSCTKTTNVIMVGVPKRFDIKNCNSKINKLNNKLAKQLSKAEEGLTL